MPNVLITGANRGIGLEFAKQYAGDGWEVIGTARDPGDADELNGLDGVEVKPLDVADPFSVVTFMDGLGSRPVDLFLNNAGIYGGDGLDPDDWLNTFAINSIAPTLLATRLRANVATSDLKKMAVLTSKMGSMTDNESGGAIVYRSSKAAVNAAWKSLSIDFADDGIAMVMLHPGWVQTDMGGENAAIDTETSVTGLRKVIDGLSAKNSGRFVGYDGEEIGW